MSEFLCIGDYICLYCEETEGYVFSWQTSSTHNGIYIYQRQDRDKPEGIPIQQAVTFQVCIQNRYKLNKKYRKIQDINKNDPDNLETKAMLSQAKAAAVAENEDNISEQRRQKGKRVRYGDVIQLKHQFTGKHVHVSTTHTSRRDKNNMMVCLQNYNAKHAQFRILPRYKVKSEGEVVQIYDQIVLESIKSPGQYFHASVPWQIGHFNFGSELNLGVDQTGFTLVKSYKPEEEKYHFVRPTALPEDELLFVRGGCVIRLFHKELEAYLVAEGLFEDKVTEDVHLRIREVDQLVPKTLYPSTSGITYWQVEAESSILKGDIVRWEQQIRFRNLTTRLYLSINSDMQVCLTNDSKDPNTVFRLHPVIKEADEIVSDSYARIEHVLSGFWLHALKDDEYSRKQMQGSEDDNSMRGLKWDGASLRKISVSGERMYHDAYTIQVVEEDALEAFNFVSGMIPSIMNVIKDKEENKPINVRSTHETVVGLGELKTFMFVQGVPCKTRQKLMRNLKIIDLLVRLLQFPLEGEDEGNLIQLFKAAYEVLHTYMIGNSRKNALYFAKYIDFFQTQFSVQGGIGLNVAQMIVELIRDNRKIVDRITRQQIDEFIELLYAHKNYRYLDLLNVLCVCDGVAIPDNQTYIAEKWLKGGSDGVFLTEKGQNIRKQTNVVYISTDNAETWIPLHDFMNRDDPNFNEDECFFLEHQLDLFRKLSHGRNELAVHIITRELNYLTWEEAFLCLRLDLLPDHLRAKYCDLIIGLFVDVGNNYSVLDYTNISFVYEELDNKDRDGGDGELVVKDLVTIFPTLRDWIAVFLGENKGMTASLIGHNMLIEQVLRLLHFLVKFGYYGNSRDINELQKPLLNLLDGKNDKPVPDLAPGKGMSKQAQKMLQQFRTKDRFLQNPETTAIVNAKYQAMEVLDLLLSYQFNTRLKSFVCMFKEAELAAKSPTKHSSPLEVLLYENYDALDTNKKSQKEQKRMVKVLRDMFEDTAYFDAEQLTSVLLDLANYKYDKMVTKSLALLNKYFSSKTGMFKMAVQAQVLMTTDSVRVHREVQKHMPIIRRLAKAKLNDEQTKTMGDVLDHFKSICALPFDPDQRHPMNQSILINHEVLSVVFEILSQEIDSRLMEQYRGVKTIVVKTLKLLKALALDNDTVQRRIYDRMDTLLKVRVVESDLAITLREAFVGNQAICLKVLGKQIQKVVLLVAEQQENAPEFLDVLTAIVKVEGLDIPLKRNQAYVMKYLMQTFNRTAYVLDQSRELREKILTGGKTEKHLHYLVGLVKLLACCAEGENRFIESLCQTILPIDEILWVISHDSLNCNIKLPYVLYAHWVYMKASGSFVETGSGELTHDPKLWYYIENLVKEIKNLTDFVNEKQAKLSEMINSPAPKGSHIFTWKNRLEGPDALAMALCMLLYIFDGVMPFLRTFYTKFYTSDKEMYPKEVEITDDLANALLAFCDTVKEIVSNPSHLKTLLSTMTTLLPSTTLSLSVIEGFIERFGEVDWLKDSYAEAMQSHDEYYSEELELNAKFRTFAVNSSLLYGGHNTVAAQLKDTSKHAVHKEYTDIGGDEALPLGEEFQDHLRCFIKPQEKKIERRFERFSKIIEQLGISSNMATVNETSRLEQEELDMKCLQLLRALIHNEIVRLSDDWEESLNKNRKQLSLVRDIQCVLTSQGAVEKLLPLLAKPSDDISREVLAVMPIILFNANNEVQKAMIEYFRATREEVFFMAVRNRMNLSTIAIKERRAHIAQENARMKEAAAQAKSLQTTMSTGRRAMQEIQNYENQLKRSKSKINDAMRKVNLASLQSKASKNAAQHRKNSIDLLEIKDLKVIESKDSRKHEPVKNGKRVSFINNSSNHVSDGNGIAHTDGGDMDQEELELTTNEMTSVRVEPSDKGEDNPGLDEEEENKGCDEEFYKDDGYIDLVLKLLAAMCDGQYDALQNYLRDQPDNIKSFNIVAETTIFVNMVYSNINGDTIDLVIQLFSTLNEFAAGNQSNRNVIVSTKVVDYINFILRAGEFEDCEMEQVLELRKTIADLLVSLTEENGPEPLTVAKEVKDTVDKEALFRVMVSCYEIQQTEKPKFNGLIKKGNLKNFGGYIKSAKNLAKLGKQYVNDMMEKNKSSLKEAYMDVGFAYYLVLQRLHDIDPKMARGDLEELTPEQDKAFKYFKKNCMSIEIVKDDHLQKVNFRVKNKNVLREQVKEKLKWSVNRSSPSNKIRDLMAWSKDIIKDIYYQRRILSNPIAAFITKHWLLWNQIVIFISMIINAIMLFTWEAKFSVADIPSNATSLPEEIFDPRPNISNFPQYYDLMLIAGLIHNFFSLVVLISYFLSNHPKLPSVGAAVDKIKKCCGKHKDVDEEQDEKDHESMLEIKFFSFVTFYYLAFLGLSVAGTAFHGYCFAFHLLNIVNNNQLLGGVIQAITQNGRSLLWVAILGLIIFYIFAIIMFALARSTFPPKEQLYCATLLQCTLSLIRYGLIGDIENIRLHSLQNNFTSFIYLSIFQVSFFILITTIGLNIIFGIIVDTFSELRDLKWTAESDMRDVCFICSRNSYDFEHHGMGFNYHVKNEHNMWAYIFFFIHLDDTKANDYTALELFVSKLLRQEKYDFFPINRALCLSVIDGDSTESKIDELLQYVVKLVEKQKEEESEKKRQEERLQQKRWQEQHRQAMRSQMQEQDSPHDPESALRRYMQVRDTGRPKWVPVEFETTHL